MRKVTGRSGVTLIEVLLASSILAVLLVGTFNMFMVTQRQATTNESVLHSGILAQMVIEQIKDRAMLNPRYLRDLMAGKKAWSTEGTVVEPTNAVNPETLQLSPYFQFLFSRESSDLYAEGNRVSILDVEAPSPTGMQPQELKAMVTAFRDHQVAVTIEDDVDLETGAVGTPFSESVKVITVTASRSSLIQKNGKDPLAVSLTTRIVTPAESLSADALDWLASRYNGPTLEELWEEFFLVAGTNPYMTTPGLGLDSRRVLADAFLVLAGANNESLLITGEAIDGSLIIDAAPDADFIDPWIQKLSASDAIGFSSSKSELGKLQRRKATVIFDSFKRIRLPMAHLVEYVEDTLIPRITGLQTLLETSIEKLTGFSTEMAKASSDFQKVQAKIDQLEAQQAKLAETTGSVSSSTSGTTSSTTTTTDPTTLEKDLTLAEQQAADLKASIESGMAEVTSLLATTDAALSGDVETVILASYLQQFYTDPAYAPFAKRPARYADRFRQTIDALDAILTSHIDQSEGVSPLERVGAAQSYVEASQVRHLHNGGLEDRAQVQLRSLARQWKEKMLELSRYIELGETYDLAALTARNQGFKQRSDELKNLCPRYQRMIDEFLPGGRIANFLLLYSAYVGEKKLETDGMMGSLSGVLDGKKSKKD